MNYNLSPKSLEFLMSFKYTGINLWNIGERYQNLPDTNCSKCKYGGNYTGYHCALLTNYPGDKCALYDE